MGPDFNGTQIIAFKFAFHSIPFHSPFVWFIIDKSSKLIINKYRNIEKHDNSQWEDVLMYVGEIAWL